MKKKFASLLVFMMGGSLALPCRGDVFTFKDGRVISGRVIAPPVEKKVDEKVEKVWTIELEPGTFIQILESSLARNGHSEPKEAENAYLTALADLEETADAHFTFAGLCISAGLRDLADAHYLRALDLDPNHGNARAALGFDKDPDGRWVKRAKVMESLRGKVQYQGSWWFPEELAIAKAEEERQAKRAAATKQLTALHKDALSANSKRQAAAIAGFEQLNDPVYLDLITEILQGKRRLDTPSQMRILYLKVLSRMETPEASRVAAHVSMTDDDETVRNAAIDCLQERYLPAARGVYLGYLSHKDNLLVNRAADALSLIGSEESVMPLIQALVTEHTRTVGGGNTTYSPDGGMTFGGKPQVQKIKLDNPSVLGALSKITQQNFEYNQPAWLTWYASIYAAPAPDLRRDP